MHELSQNLNDLTELVNYSAENFQKKIIFEGENKKTVMLAFSAGQGLPDHKTPKEALLVMLEGVCEFNMFGFAQFLKAGEVIIIPAGEMHHLKAFSDFKMLLIK